MSSHAYYGDHNGKYYRHSGNMESLSELIKKHRRMSGLSQAELAKLAGVGKTVVFDLEHGKQSMRYDTLTKILSVLNITVRFDSPLIARLSAEKASPERPPT
jgi:y4mF family transcriptional regulator